MPTVSIIIPALNEADSIQQALQTLQPLREQGHQIILVDGNSQDDTIALATPLCDRVIKSAAGRARQMNAGAAIANGDFFLFLHADTKLPNTALNDIRHSNKRWGRFNVMINGKHWAFPLISHLINLRSCISGVATGDQAIFVEQALFKQVSGYADIPLMEDVALSKTLRRIQRPACLNAKVITSGRRWEKHGVLRTILLMWSLRLAYFIGISPHKLARFYASH